MSEVTPLVAEPLPDVTGELQRLDASLARMGLIKMPLAMLVRYRKKLTAVDLGYVDEDTGVKSDCHVWTGASHSSGYGRFYLGKDSDGKRVWAYSHRAIWEHHFGPIKPGYIVDHKCNNKACNRVDPDRPELTHLKPETQGENLRLASIRRPWKRRNQYSVE